MEPKKIYYATTNKGKFEEVKRYIDEHEPSISLIQFEKNIPEIQTLDQKAIAVDKANQAWNELKQPVLVDDSGIYFEHYKNFPGTLTRFVFDGIGFEGLLKLTEDDNRAAMRLYMIYKENDTGHHIFEGLTKGTIIRPNSFDSHPNLPYDAIFKPAESDKTMALIRGTFEEKKFAYRLKAIKKFISWYKEEKTS